MQHHDRGMQACGLRSKQQADQLGPAISAGKVDGLRLRMCIGDNQASGAGHDDCRACDKAETCPPRHAAP
jgi:hypothetical protein